MREQSLTHTDKKIKIGIMTFHWSANHGAVLQAYALSKYLEKNFHADAEIINYYPKTQENTFFNTIKKIRSRMVIRSLKQAYKERYIKPFRAELNLTKRYYKNAELILNPPCYDILIAGSDQIWNPSFLRYGEKSITPVYYLNFGGKSVKKISVSASLGCEKLPDNCLELVRPLLEEFADISVREKTGKVFLEGMGIASHVTADPTALLSSEECLSLCSRANFQGGRITKMILRKQSKEINKLIALLCKRHRCDKAEDIEYLSIPDWLSAIRDSELLITNSFHCVMMCLKLHTPFVVILEQGKLSGMNDRFMTLLGNMGLTDRIVNSYEDIENASKEIDFKRVDCEMENYAASLKQFLERNIC